jgi:hypothetical protein
MLALHNKPFTGARQVTAPEFRPLTRHLACCAPYFGGEVALPLEPHGLVSYCNLISLTAFPAVQQQQRACGRSGQADGRGFRRCNVQCSASAAAPPTGPSNTLLVRAVEQLFKFPPFFDLAAANVSPTASSRQFGGLPSQAAGTCKAALFLSLLCHVSGLGAAGDLLSRQRAL